MEWKPSFILPSNLCGFSKQASSFTIKENVLWIIKNASKWKYLASLLQYMWQHAKQSPTTYISLAIMAVCWSCHWKGFSSQKFKERKYHKRLIAAVSASARCISANDYIIRNNYKWSKCMNTQDFLKVWLIIFLLQPRTLIMKYLNIVSSAFSGLYSWKQKESPLSIETFINKGKTPYHKITLYWFESFTFKPFSLCRVYISLQSLRRLHSFILTFSLLCFSAMEELCRT